ncbi:hypothetical protein, partial [Mesorhizobium sp.]|uniref:hypothetical protein n=1 Tax=Mesorhizobium sp. TaxID=1871066 RepID=UPI0025EBED04
MLSQLRSVSAANTFTVSEINLQTGWRHGEESYQFQEWGSRRQGQAIAEERGNDPDAADPGP